MVALPMAFSCVSRCGHWSVRFSIKRMLIVRTRGDFTFCRLHRVWTCQLPQLVNISVSDQ
jgi:hypothetical protein